MITFSKSEVEDLDSLLEYLFNKQSKYSILDDPSKINFDQISVSCKELQKKFSFSDLELNKYLQIFFNRNQKNDLKFIQMDQTIEKIWLLDRGLEFYFLGGFKRERKEQLTKRHYEIAGIIFGIIASLGVLLSIYFNVRDTKRLEKRIEKIELNQKTNVELIDK